MALLISMAMGAGACLGWASTTGLKSLICIAVLPISLTIPLARHRVFEKGILLNAFLPAKRPWFPWSKIRNIRQVAVSDPRGAGHDEICFDAGGRTIRMRLGAEAIRFVRYAEGRVASREISKSVLEKLGNPSGAWESKLTKRRNLEAFGFLILFLPIALCLTLGLVSRWALNLNLSALSTTVIFIVGLSFLGWLVQKALRGMVGHFMSS
jgi:hypothetical protein